MSKINKQYIKQLINEGYIRIKEYGDLYLLNYTNKCIYEKKWNKYTINNRGNIYEKNTNKLIAKAFSKFFNLGELSVSLQRSLLKRIDYKCYEKYDGSLGIIYNYKGEWRINTRGSFNSEQSIKAHEILNNKGYLLDNIDKNLTLLVEIIYPKNRIIIDYGNKEDLVLLSGYSRVDEKECRRDEIEEISKITHIPLVKEYNLTFDEMFEFQKKDYLTKEGFVVRFSDEYRIKIKSKRYLDIARIMSNLTPLSLWKNMNNGHVKQDHLEAIPEEFRIEMNEIILDLEQQYINIEKKILKEFEELIKIKLTRKDIGLNNNIKHKSCMFSLLDNKLDKIDIYIMKRIRPKEEHNEKNR